MIAGVQNIGRIQELRQRILFTFGMLAVYRVGAYIVTPGIDPEVVRNFFAQMQGTIFGLFTLFSGGALEQLSIFSLGIMPYISASIIFQLLTIVIPQLEELKKEGEQGQRRINQFTRYATIGLALFQGGLLASRSRTASSARARSRARAGASGSCARSRSPPAPRSSCGSASRSPSAGSANGISLIIFAGIVIRIPSAMSNLLQLIRTDQFSLLQTVAFAAMAMVVVFFVIIVERGQRRIPIQNARRVVGKGACRRQHVVLPAAREHRGRDPGDLRLVAAALPAHDRPVHEHARDRAVHPGPT
jgi:preprotein translocase subunit SecY